MNVEELYQQLKKAQEPRGYYFNQNQNLVMDLLKALLINKERYGYMSCPCRLACGDREKDRDIICPCFYRGPDITEFGSCYCALYVSREWNDSAVPHGYVPERRPLDKM